MEPGERVTALVAAHSDDAIYTGLALLQTPTGPFLLAANFRHGRIDVFDGNWNPVNVGSAFTDPALPAGYAPFNVEVLGGSVYVATPCRARTARRRSLATTSGS